MTEPQINVRQLAAGLRQLAATLRANSKPAMPPILHAEEGGRRRCAVVCKRTYRVENGVCVLAPPERQDPICMEDVPYELVELPGVSPLVHASEMMPFKRATDVVVQGFAHAYDDRTTRTMVQLRFAGVERTIVAFGDRRGELDAAGRPRFGEPERFRAIPLRWDRAYGGFDAIGFLRRASALDGWAKHAPPEAFELSPFHYPRNPSGRGYMTELTRDGFEGELVPNLEHPFDPLRPERLATGHALDWMKAPLPAAWDFVDLGWFPRGAYLGCIAPYRSGPPPREIERGWAAKDLLATRSILHASTPSEVRTELAQAAAPGLSIRDLPLDTEFTFENLHPLKPVHSVRLPADVPHVEIDLGGPSWTAAEPRMTTIVHRVPLNEVEIGWASVVDLPEHFEPSRIGEVDRRVSWSRAAEKGGSR